MQQLRIDSILAGHAVAGPGHPAITFNGKVTDFAGLEAQVASMAGWLAASGVGSGGMFSPPTWHSGRMFSTRSSGGIA